MSDIQSNYQKYHSHISSKHKWFDLKLKEVWNYKDLIWLFTKRSFVVTYKQTVLGPAWLVINPIITSLIYAFVFGGIAGMGTDGVPQMAFYLPSTAIWTFFAACVTNNATTFTANAAVFGKVYFPRLTTPISNVLSSMIQFLIQFTVALLFIIFYVIQGVCPAIDHSNFQCYIINNSVFDSICSRIIIYFFLCFSRRGFPELVGILDDSDSADSPRNDGNGTWNYHFQYDN